MLGLSSSVNSEEGYAKGERFRERWTDHVGTYNVVSNPIGFNGYDYIGDFSSSSDANDFVASNADLSVTGDRFIVDSTSGNGYASIAFSTTIGVSYTLSVDVAVIESLNASIVQIGTSPADTSYHTSGNLTSTGPETDTFTPTTKNTYLTLRSKVSGKYVRYDNISLITS